MGTLDSSAAAHTSLSVLVLSIILYMLRGGGEEFPCVRTCGCFINWVESSCKDLLTRTDPVDGAWGPCTRNK